MPGRVAVRDLVSSEQRAKSYEHFCSEIINIFSLVFCVRITLTTAGCRDKDLSPYFTADPCPQAFIYVGEEDHGISLRAPVTLWGLALKENWSICTPVTTHPYLRTSAH